MGVPLFYRWLTNKYPNVVAAAVEEKGGDTVDASLPNPNGMEFDNLYLDMNGIIHPCFHPDDHIFPPVTCEEVYHHIFEYIDRLFNIVRPRKLLYMAIDGVAPRAKMNQQRTRRFRNSKDNELVEKEEERLRRRYEKEGKDVLPKVESEVSDSNVITPGTLFMYQLSKELQSYICTRMKNDPGWKQIKVILSDANVPGEGEHKIMSFIRLQRTFPGYNPNTRHCVYGLDADLIMLALTTHEIHFSILREDVQAQVQNPISAFETSLAEAETSVKKSRGWFKQLEGNQITEEESSLMSNRVERTKSLVKKPYQFVQVWILRDYLELDLKIINLPKNFQEDVERTIDDFIFFCFLAGNDFLPHMPSLEINEGGIDLLMHVYKEEFEKLGGYLVDMQRADDKKGGYIKLKRVEKFILSVGKFEEQIFKKRSEIREKSLRRALAECAVMARDDEEEDAVVDSPRSDRFTSDNSEILQNTKQLKEELKSCTRKLSDAFRNGISTDKVRFGAPGWKARYFKEKLSAETQKAMEGKRKELVEKYMEGLCWVLLYYFSGVTSWDWFYPFHYGPFASDMKGLAQTNVRFKKSAPFKPFDQLLGVLPPKSAHAMPTKYQMLMTDEQSSIIDFYPTDFEVDVDGKRFQWQGICKLDFIDEKRLLAETKKIESELNEEEAKRNSQTDDHLFVGSSSALGSNIKLHREDGISMDRKDVIEIDTSLSGEIYGFVSTQLYDEVGVDSDGGHVICVPYKLPPYSPHKPRLLEGVHIPEKTVSEVDIVTTQLWHEYPVSRPGYNRFPNQEHARKLVSTSTSSEAVIKCAGVVWNAEGRGKVSHSFHMQNKFIRVPGDCSELATSSAREPKGDSTSRGETRFTYKSTQDYKSLGYDLAESRRLEDLKIPQPDRDLRQPYRPPSARSARANEGFNSNQEWRESSVRSTAPNRNDNNQDIAAGFRGRGQYGSYSGGGTSFSRGRGRYASSNDFDASFARGRGRYSSNGGFDTSFSRGRGRYASSNDFDTSFARGRGRYSSNGGFDTSSSRGGGGGYESNSRW